MTENETQVKKYYLALRAFVAAFAKIESAMFLVLTRHAKTKLLVARAVFSGVRTDAAAGFLRRLAEVGIIKEKEWLLLEPVLVQIGKINDLRNILLHHVTIGIDEREGIVTDALRSLNETRMRSYPVSPSILDDATYDCRKAFLHLATRHLNRSSSQEDRKELRKVLNSSWRYIPPKQESARRGERKSRQ